MSRGSSYTRGWAERKTICGRKPSTRHNKYCKTNRKRIGAVSHSPDKHFVCFGAQPSLNKHHLLLSYSPPSLSPCLCPPPISLFSTHISLSDSRALCCSTELRSLPSISTLHLWNPSWLPQPFTVEACHLPHGGAWEVLEEVRGEKHKEASQRGLGWGRWGHSLGHWNPCLTAPHPTQKRKYSASRGNCKSTWGGELWSKRGFCYGCKCKWG